MAINSLHSCDALRPLRLAISLTITASIALTLFTPFSVARSREIRRTDSTRTAYGERSPLAAPLPSPVPKPTVFSTPLPTATPVDGARQLTVGPYVPPALRTDNLERRGVGIQGRRAQAAPVKLG